MARQGRIRNHECAGVAPWLPGLTDGDLEDAHRSRVEEHLAGCSACAAEAEAFRRVAELLRTPVPGTDCLPAGCEFAASVLLRERAARRNLWQRLHAYFSVPVRWAAVIALASGVLLGAAVFRRQTAALPTKGPRQTSSVRLPALVVIDDERLGREVMVAR